jgi:heterodisulfide reductase subunit A-like polyferredoxin
MKVRDDIHADFYMYSYLFWLVATLIKQMMIRVNIKNEKVSILYQYTRMWGKYLYRFYKNVEDDVLKLVQLQEPFSGRMA